MDNFGRKAQRAEIRFDDIAGRLRTLTGGPSRQTIVDGKTVRSRLISPRETARLMGLPEDYDPPPRSVTWLSAYRTAASAAGRARSGGQRERLSSRLRPIVMGRACPGRNRARGRNGRSFQGKVHGLGWRGALFVRRGEKLTRRQLISS